MMPPVRHARHAQHPTGSPYPDGLLSYRHRRRSPRSVEGNVREKSDDSGGAPPSSPTTLPDDVLFGIFSRVPSFTDAARCAATCRRWGRVVAARAAPISRALPPPPPGRFLPHLAIGAFLQENNNHRRARGEEQMLRFVPMPLFASRLLDQGRSPAHDARPVASRNGRVVLQLGGRAAADGLTLCVWNPMTGEVAMVPPLSRPKEFPTGDHNDCYACAIVTGDDLADGGVPLCSPGSFRLLLVYGRRDFTALRFYSSETGRWGPECKKPGAKISGSVLRQLGPAVVLHGVAYWHMHHAAFGVRLGGTETMDVCSVPYTFTRCKLDEHVLGVSPDGRLNFVGVGICSGLGLLRIKFLTSQLQDIVGYKSTTTTTSTSIDDPREEPDIGIPLPQIKVTSKTPIKLWWFGEKSGTLIFTVGEETSRTSDVFALNVATRSLEKLADAVPNHTSCRRLYGYEMDRAALLASIAP